MIRLWFRFRCQIGWHEWGPPIFKRDGWVQQDCRFCEQLVGLWKTNRLWFTPGA